MNVYDTRMALLARGERLPVRRPEATMSKGIAQLRIYDWIGDSVQGVNATMVGEALDSLKGARELEVFINSPGGSAADGVAIYNLLGRFPGRKTFYNDALAASAASVIFLAGDERIMMPGSQVMVHGPSGLVMGDADAMEREAKSLRELAKVVGGIYLSRTGQPQQVVDGWLASNAENNFDGPAAVAAGLATRVADATMAAATKRTLSTSARGISPLDLARLRERAVRNDR